jgi:hypothetical protein
MHAPPNGPVPASGPIRQLFTMRSAQGRWPLGIRAAVSTAAPVIVGCAAGDVAAGLIATLGAFTSRYGGGRPYLNRAVQLAVIAVSLAAAVALGVWVAQVPWVGVLTVSAIGVAAVGPPRIASPPSNRSPAAAAPGTRRAPHVVELRTRHDMLAQRPRPTHFDAHRVIAFVRYSSEVVSASDP